jgi:hypothetical protein
LSNKFKSNKAINLYNLTFFSFLFEIQFGDKDYQI